MRTCLPRRRPRSLHRASSRWKTGADEARHLTGRASNCAGSTPTLAQRYVHEGFWDDQALGAVPRRRSARRRGRAVHRALRPQRRTAARSATSTRSRAGSRPGCARAASSPATPSRSNCRTGSRPRRRSTRSRTSARSSCRSCTSTDRRRSSYILQRTRVKALVTADHFGHLDFLANLDAMRPDLPDLEWVAVVGDRARPEPPVRRPRRRRPDRGARRRRPDTPALIAYTSGTTSDPKGVVHSHRTIGAEIRQLGAIQPGRAGRRSIGRAGRPRHRDARRAVPAGLPARSRCTSSTCGIPAGCSRRCSRTDCRPGRARRTSSSACSTIPTSTSSGTAR